MRDFRRCSFLLTSILAVLTIFTPVAHAEKVYWAYFHGQATAKTSFGEACDQDFGAKSEPDVPNDQFQIRLNGEVRPGGVYIRDFVITVGREPYSLWFAGPFRFIGGAKQDDVRDYPIGEIEPNQSRTVAVDHEFPFSYPARGIHISASPAMGYGGDCGPMVIAIKDAE